MFIFFRFDLKRERRFARQQLEIPTCDLPVTDGLEDVLTLGVSEMETDQMNVQVCVTCVSKLHVCTCMSRVMKNCLSFFFCSPEPKAHR